MSDKAIFLDRDDTLIEDPGYISDPDQVKLLTGVPEALVELKAMGYKLIVVSNQSAIARGIISEKILGEIHSRLKQLLAEKGAYLDRIYYCPYHPDGAVPKYRKESNCRKPNPGMLLEAADELDIDLSQSWMIGNSDRDVQAGLSAGCKTILLDNVSHDKQLEPDSPKPDYKGVNMKEAVNIIKKHHRSYVKPAATAKPITIDPIQPSEEPVQPQQEIAIQQPTLQEQNVPGDRVEELLGGILEHLKKTQRADMFGEFSTLRLLAGIVQIFVMLCLLISIWLLMSPNRENGSILIAIGFAMVLQLMSLTFYMMEGRK